MSRLPSAAVTINGRPLTDTQSEVLRVALMFARRDMQSAPRDLMAMGILQHVDTILGLIDETEVTL